MESIKNKLNDLKFKSIELASQSTSHGLPKIFQSKNVILKFIWFILFIGSTSYCFYKLFEMTNQFLEYEVITNINVISEKPSDFPTITFYNQRDSKANYSIQDILIYCQFNRELCNHSYFDTIYDQHGYVSYRFKKRKTFIHGIEYGLAVAVLNKNSNNQKTVLEGLRVIIHNESIDPKFHAGYSNEGIDVSPGYMTSIAVSRVLTSKLGEPYNNCIKDTSSYNSFDSELYKYILKNTNYSYTQKDCFDYCMGREMFKYLNITNKIDYYINVWFSIPQMDIMQSIEIYKNLIRGEVITICSKECLLECDSFRYDLSISFTKANIENLLLVLDLKNSNKRFDSDNMTGFRVYYNDLSYTHISQMPKMELDELISNIGGILGLFIGISFLSLAEILELFIEFSIIICAKSNTKVQNL